MMGMLIVKKYSKFEVNTFDTDGVIDRKRKLNQQRRQRQRQRRRQRRRRRRRPGGDNSSAVSSKSGAKNAFL